MEEFTYTMKPEISAPSAKAGDTITISARLSDVVGEIRSVSVSVPRYGIWEVLKPRGDGLYSLVFSIPWEAPSEEYQLRFYATDTKGQRGPASVVNFTVR